MEKIAGLQLSPKFNNYVKEEMKKGLSYPNAMSNALKFVLGNEADAVFSPNNVLSVEYIKSAMKLNLNLEYYPVRRLGMNHNDVEISGPFHSASVIRKHIIGGSYSNLKLTEKSIQMIDKFYAEHKKYNSLNNYLDFLYYKIINTPELNKIYEIREGLDNKILSQVYKHNNIDDFIMSLKSKRYTYSRLRRSLLNILFDIKADDIIDIMSDSNGYVKVLSFNNTGRKAIKYAKNNGIKVINRYSDYRKYDLNPEKLKILGFGITYVSLG